MMAAVQKQIDFKIMGREFRVACPENEERQLLDAVSYVDRKMIEMRDKSKVIGLERIAIMTALAIAAEFLNAKGPTGPKKKPGVGSNLRPLTSASKRSRSSSESGSGMQLNTSVPPRSV